MRAVVPDGEVEAAVDDERVVPAHAPEVEQGERRHGGAFVELHRMARDAVPEIMRPRQCGRGAVREVVEPREETTDASDRNADGERQGKPRAGAGADAAQAFVKFDRDDPAHDRALDRAGNAGYAGEPKIRGTEQNGTDARADDDSRRVSEVEASGRERDALDLRKPQRRGAGSGPRQHVEHDVDDEAVHGEG